MEDIIRKQMKDVTVPLNDIVRRPVTTPAPYVEAIRDDEGDRIGKNPFFEKSRNKVVDTENKKSGGMRGILWALLFVLILSGGFVVANYFASATIEVAPVTRNVVLASNVTALKEVTGDSLVFQFMSLTQEKTKEVPATIQKKVQTKASGKVMIFNAYNSDSQRLIKNTRLEDNITHKIFHIDQSVVVPGTKVVDGKTVPGSVEALIYADVAGKEYNIGKSNFTIPGFKGDPRYAKFTGASKADSPIAGGFSGTVKVPSDEAEKLAREELKTDLTKEATEKARAQIPADVTFFPGSMIIKFEEVSTDFTVADTASVSMRATVSVFFFDTVRLTENLALVSLPEDKGNPFQISNMSALKFEFVDEVNNVVFGDLSRIRFHISGPADFVGQIDSKKISNELAGKNKKDFSDIVKKQSNVSDARAVLRPMWKTVFPSNPSKITVKILTK